MTRTCLLLLCLALLPACSRQQAGPPEQPPEPAVAKVHPGIGLGLYQISWSITPEQLALESKKLGAQPAFVMFYIDLSYRFESWRKRMQTIRAAGAVPMLSWELWHWRRRDADANILGQINAGRYDALFAHWAQALEAWKDPVMIRLGFEMNGNWFAWGGKDPAGFKKAWRRVVAIFRKAGAQNVVWVWSPNVLSVPKKAWNAIHQYYPGDDVVDWVALDGYNWGASRDDGGNRWASLKTIMEAELDDFDRRYPDKPQMIAETACAPDDGGSKAAWIRDGLAWLTTRPRVRAICWFNFDKRREKECNWRLDSDSASLEAARKALSRPPFSLPFRLRPLKK